MTRYVLVKDEVGPQFQENPEKENREEDEDREEHEMLIGRSMDAEPARDRWIDAVEKILENESLENGEQHIRKNFDEVRHDGDYRMNEHPRWML